MQEDLLTINQRFDTLITDLETRLNDLKLRKQQAVERVKRYHNAIKQREEAIAIIREGKPVV